jgi:signal transduction histidine kinase
MESREPSASLGPRLAERAAEVQRLEDQLRALARDLMLTEQHQRRGLALVLHDHVQQPLVAARMQLGQIRRSDKKAVESALTAVESMISEALNASRSLAVELNPTILHEAGAGRCSELAGQTDGEEAFVQGPGPGRPRRLPGG